MDLPEVRVGNSGTPRILRFTYAGPQEHSLGESVPTVVGTMLALGERAQILRLPMASLSPPRAAADTGRDQPGYR